MTSDCEWLCNSYTAPQASNECYIPIKQGTGPQNIKAEFEPRSDHGTQALHCNAALINIGKLSIFQTAVILRHMLSHSLQSLYMAFWN